MNKISVVLCHHQGNLIFNALKSIKTSKYVDIEIIVMTSVKDLICPDADRVVYCEGGPAKKRNFSVRYCIGDYIAFFDDDVIVNNTAIYEMFRCLSKDSTVGMVFGKLLRMDDGITFDEAGSFLTKFGFLWARGDNVKDIGQFEVIEPVLSGKSASCMIKRKAFCNAGYFDESYEILGEESDLSWRVWITGKRVLYVPKSITLHAFNTKFKPQDFYTKERVYYNGCKNYISMLSTNLEKQNLLRIVSIHIMIWFFCALGMFCRFRFKEGYLILKGINYNFKNIESIKRKRSFLKKIRVGQDSYIFHHCMKTPAFTYYFYRFFRYLKGGVHG